MNTQNNPFVLPGLGQTGDLASNPMIASLEMMQQAWTHLAGPGGLTQALPMNLEDLDKRLAELRTVENWLKLNQSMLASTIQAMEVQRATIATLKSFVGTAPGGDTPSPLEVVLGIKPAPAASAATSATATDTPADGNANQTASVGAAAAAAAQSATQAWWNLMQQQFGQLANAAARSMTEAAPSTAPDAPSPPKTRVKRAAPPTRSAAAKSANTSKPVAKTASKSTKTAKATPKTA